MKPSGQGALSLFSGNGRVRVALGETAGFRIRVQTGGRLFNHLEHTSAQTEEGATVVVRGDGGFALMIRNHRGGVSLLEYDDFDRIQEQTPWDEELFEDHGPAEFFRGLFGHIDPEEWEESFTREFEREIPRFVEKMERFGQRFGRLGEEISRQFHESRPKRDQEVEIILEMLAEGKISAEEAERLIRAVRDRREEG